VRVLFTLALSAALVAGLGTRAPPVPLVPGRSEPRAPARPPEARRADSAPVPDPPRPARAGSSRGLLPSSVSAFSPQSLLGRENGLSAAHPARARSRRARRCGCEPPSPPGE
jgi:hypothetical protein